jgi:membrane protease YdiL (CAAX protease family)
MLALLLWLLVAGLQVLAAFGLASGSSDSNAPGDQPLYEYSLAIGSLVLYGILLAVTFWIASLFPDRLGALGLRRFPLRTLWLVLAVVVLGLVVSAALEPVLHAGREQGLEPDRWEPSRAAPFLLNALVIVTVVPFTEELFFRGLGVRVLTVLGSVGAAVASALVFGLAHGILVAVPALGFFGLCLAWLRLRTGSIWPGVLAHALYNGIGIAAFFATT